VDYVGAVILVAAVVYLIIRWRRSRGGTGGAHKPEPAADVVTD
jgi:hypothetical protein